MANGSTWTAVGNGSSSHISLERQQFKRKKSTNINSQVQGDSTYLDYDLDPDIFKVPWLDAGNNSTVGMGSGSGVVDGKMSRPAKILGRF